MKTDLSRIKHSLMYEVFQSTTMLLFMLSGISTMRQKHQLAAGVATSIPLPGLPEICFSPCIINAPDDYLYGPAGAAAQLAYMGWVAEVYALWECRFRKELKESFGSDASIILPEFDTFGDLRRIRNDFLHNNRVASREHTGKCKVLKWFEAGDKIVFSLNQVFDFLNQAGFLLLAHDHERRVPASAYPSFNDHGYSYGQTVHHDRDKLLNWKPEPKIISVRNHQDNQDSPRFKGVTVVFNNGLFAPIPFGPLDSAEHQARLGKAKITADGNIQFNDGTVQHARSIYRDVVKTWCEPISKDEGPSSPVTGPWMKIRK